MRFYVVDSNCFRSTSVPSRWPLDVAEVQEDASNRLVVPDLSLFEKVKCGTDDATLRRDLELLARWPERVHLSASISTALKHELAHGTTFRCAMLDHEATEFLRRALREVRDGSKSDALRTIIDDAPSARQMLSPDYLSHEQNLQTTQELVGVFERMLGPKLVNALRRRVVSLDEKVQMIRSGIGDLMCEALLGRGMLRPTAQSLVDQRSIIYRWYAVRLWQCIELIEGKAIANVNKQEITNSLIDHEYVITASVFHGFLSRDAGAQESYEALKRLLAD